MTEDRNQTIEIKYPLWYKVIVPTPFIGMGVGVSLGIPQFFDFNVVWHAKLPAALLITSFVFLVFLSFVEREIKEEQQNPNRFKFPFLLNLVGLLSIAGVASAILYGLWHEMLGDTEGVYAHQMTLIFIVSLVTGFLCGGVGSLLEGRHRRKVHEISSE